MDPRTALDTIDRAARRVRQERWWYVGATLLMAVFTAACHVAMTAFPAAADDLVLPGVLLVVVVVGLIGLRQRMVDRTAGRRENTVVGISVGLAVLAALLNRFVVPDGHTSWAVLVSMLPAVPFAILAWRVARG